MAISDRKVLLSKNASHAKVASVQRIISAVNIAHKSGELKVLAKSSTVKPPKLRVSKIVMK